MTLRVWNFEVIFAISGRQGTNCIKFACMWEHRPMHIDDITPIRNYSSILLRYSGIWRHVLFLLAEKPYSFLSSKRIATRKMFCSMWSLENRKCLAVSFFILIFKIFFIKIFNDFLIICEFSRVFYIYWPLNRFIAFYYGVGTHLMVRFETFCKSATIVRSNIVLFARLCRATIGLC